MSAQNIPEITLKKNKTEFLAVDITSPKAAADYCRQFYFDDIEIYESFFLLLLNRASKTIGYVKISQGGVCGTIVDPTLVAKYAIESLAKQVILCHNHPSGRVDPSPQDIAVTEKIKAGLSLFDIRVADHIILSADSYYSFGDEGRI